MLKKIMLFSAVLVGTLSVASYAEEAPTKSQNPLKECYSASRTMVGLMPKNLFEACINVQKGPLTRDEYRSLKLARKKGLISRTDLFRLKNHYRVTPEYYKTYKGSLKDWQFEEWRRRDVDGYFEAVYDQVETEIRRILNQLEITQELDKKEAVQRITNYLIRSADYTLEMILDTQIRGKIGDNPKAFVDRDKKLFTGYEKKGQYELDEMFNVLIRHKGVCISYSILLSNLFDRLGIVNAPLMITSQKKPIGHVAVVVLLDGDEYVIDPVLEQSKLEASRKTRPKQKNKMLHNIKEYRELLAGNGFVNASIDRAEMENSYARIENHILTLKKQRAERQSARQTKS